MQQSRRRWMILVVAIALLAGSCTSGGDDDDDATRPADGPTRSTEGPLRVRLSSGEATAAADTAIRLVTGDPLDEERVASILSRLPALVEEPDDRSATNLPAPTLRPPIVGQTVAQSFPPPVEPPTGPPEVPTGPLQVLRHQPDGSAADGDVDIAPFLSLTFDRPMVALATLDQLDQVDVPVTVEPDLAGRWRWIGTRTLRFEHDPSAGAPAGAPDDATVDRLPMATEYTVTVPAGTTAVDGSALADAVTWTFRTPPARVVALTPVHDALPLTPVLVATFDQVVDPEAVVAALVVTADGDRRPVRVATPAEVEADDDARQATGQALPGRWVAFRPVDPFPADRAIVVTFPSGLPSAEGPRTTEADQTFRGRTYPRFAVARAHCGWDGRCQPGQELTVELTTPIDPETFERGDVTVTPDIPGLTVVGHGNRVVVRGDTRARTTYEITLPQGLRDTFGQALDGDRTAEVEVGDAAPVLRFDHHHQVVTVDPLAPTPSFGVSTIGHDRLRVRVYAAEVSRWGAYRDFAQRWDRDTFDGLPGWTLLRDEAIATEPDEGRFGETTIDLGPELDGPGHVVVVVESTLDLDRNGPDWWSNRPVVVWVQRTDIGLDAIADHRRLVAWATDLRTGAPVEGVAIEPGGSDRSLTTGADGLATFDPFSDGTDHLVARRGDDTALLVAWELQHRLPTDRTDTARWHLFDDRGLYRPGETAHLKGWVRRLTLSGDAQLAPIDAGATVAWTAHDAFGNQIAAGQEPVTRLGGFDLAVEIPAGAGLGDGWVQLRLDGAAGIEHAAHHHQLRLAEFRRPEFEVTTRPQSPGPHLVTQPATVEVTGRYLSGGVLADAPVTWSVRTRPGTYSPPGWDGFTFGVWEPWWPIPSGIGRLGGAMAVDVAWGGWFPPAEEEIATFSGRTDGTGRHLLRIDFEGAPEGQPVVVSANAAVTDVNRQQLADTTDLLVHAASLYVGLRSDRAFVDVGTPLPVEAVVTDIDGEAVAGREVTVTAERMEWDLVDGQWTEVAIDAETCEVASGPEPVECDITPTVGGRYRITAAVSDDDGGTNTTVLTRWVSGQGRSTPQRQVGMEALTLVPDAETYAGGDTAEVLVQAPFATGTGLLTVVRNGITSVETFEVVDATAVLRVPVRRHHAPGLDLVVEVVGTAARTGDAAAGGDAGGGGTGLPSRPAYAVGMLHLDVPPVERTLAVTVTPAADELRPGATTTVDVAVVDAAGRSVEGAELAVVVVDEAVLSLTGYQLADPLAAMYAPFDDHLTQLFGRSSIVLARADLLAGAALGFGGADDSAEAADGAMTTAGGAAAPDARRTMYSDQDAAGGPADPIEVRTDFDALAVFDPEVVTDAAGRATVEVPLPDDLTRYRVMVTAAAGAGDFGSGESNLTARLPVQARPSAPRFLNYGDAFELPVVVHNQTDRAVVADVVVEATNLALGERSARVEVPAGDRVEVRFPAEAVEPGTARIRATVVTGDHADAATVELPVHTPATFEAFATYGVVDEGGVLQPLTTPEGVITAFGGLDVSLSSTSLQTLTDAVLDLVEYRYDHVDAYASRILAIVALGDVLAAFDVEGLPGPEQLTARVDDDLAAMAALQNADGGFGTWARTGRSDPYRSVQATHALVAARAAGHAPDPAVIDAALAYTTDVERSVPADWPEDLKALVEAYALHVRFLAGDRDQAGADRLLDRRSAELGLDGLAWLWPVAGPEGATAIARTIDGRVTETPAAATFTTDHGESAHLVLASDRRTDGIVLDALIRMRPASDLIPKVVTGLIGNQRRGAWGNVQENSFILLALKAYFDAYEAQTPDFVARVWLGDRYAAEVPHRGRSVDTALTHVPMADLVAGGDPAITLTKTGTGRLYYRLGLRYAPEELVLDARDEGFVVDRVYEAIDDDGDVTRGADGTWRIRAGANVRVVITMVADGRRTNMALVDPVPAGLEVLNPDLATAVDIAPEEIGGGGGPVLPLARGWWWGTWYDHQNQRDDRAEAFAGFLPAGTYRYSYVARATTPGTFVTPPARAEELYSPEVFGRSASDRVVVTER